MNLYLGMTAETHATVLTVLEAVRELTDTLNDPALDARQKAAIEALKTHRADFTRVYEAAAKSPGQLGGTRTSSNPGGTPISDPDDTDHTARPNLQPLTADTRTADPATRTAPANDGVVSGRDVHIHIHLPRS